MANEAGEGMTIGPAMAFERAERNGGNGRRIWQIGWRQLFGKNRWVWWIGWSQRQARWTWRIDPVSRDTWLLRRTGRCRRPWGMGELTRNGRRFPDDDEDGTGDDPEPEF
jgi:hypothetical protein